MFELGEKRESIHGMVRTICLDRLGELERSSGFKTVLSHFGEFSLDFISDISERVEENMISAGDDKAVIKRMFTILIEGMKNVRQHGCSDDKGRQLGYLLIMRSPQNYLLEVANLVKKEDYNDLISYLEKINSYDKQTLLDKYDEALDKEFLNEGVGGGLGFIVTRLKTLNAIEIKDFPISEGLMLCAFSVALKRD